MKTFTIFWGDEGPRELDDWSIQDQFAIPDGSFIYVRPNGAIAPFWCVVRAGNPVHVSASAVPAKYRTQLLLLT